jgi:CBS domain-containing protein
MGNVESRLEDYGVSMPGLGAWHTKAIPTTPTGTQLEAVKTLIEGTALRDMIEIHERPLISLAAKDDLHTSFNRLVEYGIHAAPVYDEVEIESGLGGRRKVKQWVGLLDWRDFVHYVIQFFDEGDKLGMLLSEQSARDIAKNHPLLPIVEDASLLSVLAGFGQQGVRRRPVVAKDDQGERILTIVSQLDVVRWLSRHHKELSPAFSNITIQNVVEKEQTDPRFSKLRQVCNVMKDTMMADVLRLLDQSNLNGVSVVDHVGKLVANISVSDLQFVVERNLDNLFMTVEHFLQRVPRRPLITCPPTATLMEVIDKLANAGVHRIYVVNRDEEPMAVITLTDVINAVLLLATHDATLASDISAK